MSMLSSFFTDDYSIDEKPVYKRVIDKIVEEVDGANFFREPVVYLYRAIGVLNLLLFFGFVYVLFRDNDGYGSIWSITQQYTSGSFVNKIVALLLFALVSVFSLLFWINRSNSLRSKVQNGSDIVVIPIVADFVQTAAEWYGLTIAIFAPITLAYIGVIGQLFVTTSHYFDTLLGCIGLIVVCEIVAYVIISIGHFLAENMRAIATIANNVRDLGDIHRAATMAPEDTVEERSNEEETSDESEE